MTGLVCSLRDRDAMTNPQPYPVARGEENGENEEWSPRVSPETAENLRASTAEKSWQHCSVF